MFSCLVFGLLWLRVGWFGCLVNCGLCLFGFTCWFCLVFCLGCVVAVCVMMLECGCGLWGLSGDSLPLLYGGLVLWFVFDWFVLCFSLIVSDGFAAALRLGFLFA